MAPKKKVYSRTSKLKGMRLNRSGNPLRTVERRVRVAHLYLEGKSFRDIAVLEKVSHATIQQDVIKIRLAWKEEYAAVYGEKLDKEMAKIDHMEFIAWEQFHLSTVKKVKDSNNKETGETEVKNGSPIWLDKVAWCIETRLKLIGQLKQELTVNNNNTFQLDLTQLYQQAPIIDPAEEAIKLLHSQQLMPTPIQTVKEETVDAILERLEQEKVKETLNASSEESSVTT